MKKKIAVAGLGKIGLFHLSILNNFPDVEIAGLADPNGSVEKTVRGMGFDAPFFGDVETLFKSAKPDAVFVCVPPGFTRSIAEKCAAQNVSTFLEKPMAATLDDARQIAKLAEGKSGFAHAVGYMVAYYPVFEEARKLIQSGAVGPVRNYSASLFLGEVFRKQEGWRQNPKISGGGALAVVGSHLLYLVQSFFGMPSKVLARTVKLFSGVEDIVQARFDHGDFSGSCHVSWCRPGYSEMGFEITAEGTQGFLQVTENSLSLFAFENNPKFPPGWKTWQPWEIPQEKIPVQIQFIQPGYIRQDYDFVQCLGSPGKSPRVSWTEGLKVQRLIEAVYEAGQNPDQFFPVPG